MAAFSDYLEDALLDAVLNATAFSVTTPYVALFTTATDDTGGGTEVTGGSYARQSASFGAAAGGSCSNDAQIDFTDMPAATVTHVAIYDALTVGNMLVHGALSASKTVGAGDTFSFEIGQLTITLA